MRYLSNNCFIEDRRLLLYINPAISAPSTSYTTGTPSVNNGTAVPANLQFTATPADSYVSSAGSSGLSSNRDEWSAQNAYAEVENKPPEQGNVVFQDNTLPAILAALSSMASPLAGMMAGGGTPGATKSGSTAVAASTPAATPAPSATTAAS